MARLTGFDWVTLILLIVGGLNWLLVGLFRYDLVAAIFGTMSPLARVIYIVVGLTAVYIATISSRLVRRERPDRPVTTTTRVP